MAQAITYKYNMTKEYHQAFPCAYRQYKSDSHCSKIHGYAFSMKFYFGSDELDVRNWTYGMDYGGLKDLKRILEEQFDHTLLVSEDDPEMDWYKEAEKRGIAKLTILPKVGCEGLADMLYRYVNSIYVPEVYGQHVAEKAWCYRVEVRETIANMAFREGHREWNEDLLAS